MSRIEAVFIGASAGGVSAIQNLLSAMGELSIPVIFVQHLPADAMIEPHLIFGSKTPLNVSEAEDKRPIQPGHVYFAPPGYHLLIERDFSFSLSQDEPVQFARPSIDVLFESAAEVYGAAACGIVLTGANPDGANGLKAIAEAGGYTMVQDPKSAEVSLMPQAALDAVKPNFVGDIASLGQHLRDLQQEAAVSP